MVVFAFIHGIMHLLFQYVHTSVDISICNSTIARILKAKCVIYLADNTMAHSAGIASDNMLCDKGW